MKLNDSNYYSTEADMEYWSASQYKDFIGTYGRPGCEFRAMMKLSGRWKEDTTDALLIGSYVDAYFEGVNAFHIFRAGHPEMFRNDGTLYAKYAVGDTLIERIKKCDLLVKYLSGDHQTIMTGELFGQKWKIKMDSYFPGKCICDLKTTRQIDKAFWIKDLGYPVNFIQYWGYDIQGAIYQEIVRQNTGEKLPFCIVAVDKQKHPAVTPPTWVEQYILDDALAKVEANMPHLVRVKNGEELPSRCGGCDCCRDLFNPDHPINSEELVLSF